LYITRHPLFSAILLSQLSYPGLPPQDSTLIVSVPGGGKPVNKEFNADDVN
jgi:hypothetical protein